jgi:hypothetical protein
MPCISMYAGSDLPADDLDEVRSLSLRGAASDRVHPTDRAHEGHGSRPRHTDGRASAGRRGHRSRVQNEMVGDRCRKDDRLYRARSILTKAQERLDERGEITQAGLLAAGDPRGEVRTARHARKAGRPICDVADSHLAEYAGYLGCDLQDDSCPPEVRSPWRSICRWLDLTSGGSTGPYRTGRRRRHISHQGFSSGSASGSAASPTPGSARCSTPADPKGPSRPSHPDEFR